MLYKSKDLDNQLLEVLTPLGFKRIPKTRYFIRFCGDGVIQGVFWYHEPRYTAQALQYWINSIFSDPDDLFRHYLMWNDYALMLCSISCAEFIYKDNEYIPTRVLADPTEEKQFDYFKEQVLPRFERWQTQESVFRARQGSEMATAEGYPLFEPLYQLGKGLNLALFLGLTDEADKYIDEPIAFEQRREDAERERNDSKKAECIRKDKEKWIQRKAFIKSGDLHSADDVVRHYLRKCKEQNLYDYERILKGDRGSRRFILANDTEKPFFQIIWDKETVPIHWGIDSM